jgi:chromosome segregation ATPase
MNNLGAALLHKQKQQSTVRSVDFAAIEQRFNAERQNYVSIIDNFKNENESLKVNFESLKSVNDKLMSENNSLNSKIEALKVENNSLKLKNESLKSINDKLMSENNSYKNSLTENSQMTFVIQHN